MHVHILHVMHAKKMLRRACAWARVCDAGMVAAPSCPPVLSGLWDPHGGRVSAPRCAVRRVFGTKVRGGRGVVGAPRHRRGRPTAMVGQ